MPLIDHFHHPGKRRLPWTTMAQAWALSLIGWLNRRLPRDEFRAEMNLHLGRHVEADVAEFREPDVPRDGSRNGPVALLSDAPPALLTVAASFPDDLEVEIREEHDRARLVAVIELVSPANKDRAAEREAFVAKCVAYLKRGIGLVILDVVTERHANLHNELMGVIGGENPRLMSDVPTYVSGYRPVHRRETDANEIEIWPYAAVVGEPIPAVPLGLRGGPVILLDLEGTYTAAIESTGL
jgi:hypothetical protein